MEENLLQVFSTDKSESKSTIVDETSTEESELKSVHKRINEGKYAKNETEYEEPSVTDNPVVNEPSYFNLFGCGKNILNMIDAT